MVVDDISHPPYQGDYSHLRKYAAAVEKRKKQTRKRKLGIDRDEGTLIRVAPNDYSHVQLQGTKSHYSHIAAIAFVPGGQTLASVGGDGEVLLWDLRQGPTLMDRRFVSPGGRPAATTTSQRRASSLCVDADEGMMWVGHNCDIMGFSLVEGGTPTHVLRGHLQNITSLASIQPEMTLLSGSNDGMILSWGTPKGSHFATRHAVLAEDRDCW
jgi:WD40 repeat protein